MPASQTAFPTKSQESISNQPIEKIGSVAPNKEQDGSLPKFTLRVPFREVPEGAGDEARLTKAKEEACRQEPRTILDKSLKSSDKTPGNKLTWGARYQLQPSYF